MSKLNRQSQHRPQRESVKTREMESLRRENHRLAQQVARLRREVEKATGTRNVFDSFGSDQTVPIEGGPVLTPELLRDAHDHMVAHRGTPYIDIHPPEVCPQPDCGGALREVDLGRVAILVCVICKWRKRTT